MISSRQLAAIMFTDIVGFSALMGSDEQKTLEVLEKNRQIHKPIIEEYHGRWIKELGDGVMATFNTVSDAVHAAMKIMESCVAANEYQLSIGIHSAEVVFENNDVFGDGINIASRIETLGIPGSILLSKNVRDQLINKTEFQLASLGSFELKNISEPMEIFALANPGFVVPRREEILGKLEKVEKKSGILKSVAAAMLIFVSAFAIWFFNKNDKMEMPVFENSIAVLPFVNMSDDKEQEYFSDGISEEIINALAQVSELKVIGRTSSFAYKGQNQDLKIIGEKLNVNHILEGSVRKSGNTLRITAQLVKVSDGFHLYSKTYDRELKDVFAIQDEISLSLLDAIKIELLGDEKDAVLKKYTDNVEAYQLYLSGLFHVNKFTPGGFFKAIEYFDDAIAIDSSYAIAYALKAFSYMNLRDFNWMDSETSMQMARKAAQQSITLDDQNAESHLAIGRIKLHWDRDIPEATKSFRKSLSINPNNPQGHIQLGMCLVLEGHFEEAMHHAVIAENLDPFSILNLWYASAIPTMIGDFEKLKLNGEKMIELAPDFFSGYHVAGMANLHLKNHEKALEHLEKMVKLNPSTYSLSHLGCFYVSLGEKSKALEVIEEMKKFEGVEMNSNYDFGAVYASIGDYDTAFKYFDKAVEYREGNAKWINTLRFFLPDLFKDPRMEGLLERIRVPRLD